MKHLENKTFDSKREMQILDALNEVKQINKAKANVDFEKMISKV